MKRNIKDYFYFVFIIEDFENFKVRAENENIAYNVIFVKDYGITEMVGIEVLKNTNNILEIASDCLALPICNSFHHLEDGNN